EPLWFHHNGQARAGGRTIPNQLYPQPAWILYARRDAPCLRLRRQPQPGRVRPAAARQRGVAEGIRPRTRDALRFGRGRFSGIGQGPSSLPLVHSGRLGGAAVRERISTALAEGRGMTEPVLEPGLVLDPMWPMPVIVLLGLLMLGLTAYAYLQVGAGLGRTRNLFLLV